MEVDVTARFRRLAHHLALSKQYRAAALALNAAATSSLSSLAPAERASVLVQAARQLDRAGGDADRVRALSLLRRADALLADARGAAAARLEVAAIRETVSAGGGVALRAERAAAIADGLRIVREREGELRDAWDWWVFFKGRQVQSLGAQDAHVATDTAAECVRAGDVAAGIAFDLMAVQTWLGAGAVGGDGLGGAALTRAEGLVRGGGDADGKDLALLSFCCSVLGGLSRLRVGDVVGAREWGVKVAAGYDRLQAAERSKVDHNRQWKWLQGKVLRTLAHHVQAGGCRGVSDGMMCWKHAHDALRHAGILDGGIKGYPERVLFGGKLEPHAESALAVVLLESAARVRLERVELGEAAPLILLSLQMTARKHEAAGLHAYASQTAAYLLAAEWYMLKGTVEGAETAEMYLKLIISAAESSSSLNEVLRDVAQMARTQRSLLTGEKRLEGIGGGNVVQPDSQESREYVSGGVRAAALFAEGVHALRQLKVLDAKAALLTARAVVCSGGVAVNEQLSANVCTNLANLFVSYKNITENFNEMLATARHAAATSEDLITRERSLRMQRKLVIRSGGADPVILAELSAKFSENGRLLMQRRRSVDELWHFPS